MKTLFPRTCAVALCLAASHAAAQSTSWISHWRLDETSGTTARDLSPQQNNGTLINFTGNPWGPGKVGGALTFDGVNDYVDVKLNRDLPAYDGRGTAYSIAFWIKAPAQNDKRIYSEGSDKTSNPLFTIGSGRTSNSTADKLQIYIRNDIRREIINWQSNTTVFDDKWHHVAWVDVAGKAALYVDGVADTRNWDYSQVSGGTLRAPYGTFTHNKISLGGVLRASACCYLKGTLDDMRIYRFALSAADVKVVMNGGQPPCSASVGQFGYGCGAGPLGIVGSGTAQLGQSINAQIVAGQQGSAALLLLGFGPAFPVDLTGAGFTGCRLYAPLAGLQVLGIGAIDAQGRSVAAKLPVPNNPSLSCLRVALQGLTIDRAQKFEFSGVVVAQVGK